jgi:ribosomal protein S18 acetylase RimI-like enzyme
VCRESNPDIKAWLKKNGYNDTAKVEEYYENK